MCYNKKVNHIIFTGKSGKQSALCGSYWLDSFPSPKWAEEEKSLQICEKCFKADKNNKYLREHPERETVPN
jgi:hypothetical protein